MYSDFHVHTDFSADSGTPAAAQIRHAQDLGLSRICITDHQDFDFPARYQLDFTFSTDEYFKTLRELQQRYSAGIHILIGVELGLQSHLGQQLSDYTSVWPFDYVIGSVHLVRKYDPYYPDFYKGRSQEDAYREYFECVLENVVLHSHLFDSLGHLDYIVRYGPEKNRNYSYKIFRDVIDAILETLVKNGKALECNTAGLRYGLGYTNPHPDIIRRFAELGGEMITLGSDAHCPEQACFGFESLQEMLTSCGFSYYTEFHNRKPVFYPL